MSVDFSAFNTSKMLSSVATAIDTQHTVVRMPLSVATGPVGGTSATVATGSRQQHQQQQQPHPITTTKMGSRRIFSAQFKLQVLDSYRQDSDCKGNQRATARKYGIHRRQIQKWLQGESNLRSSIILNNNNNNSNNNNNANSCNGSQNQNINGKMVASNGTKRLHENVNATKLVISHNTTASIPSNESNVPLDANNGFIAFKQEPNAERAPVSVSFATAMPATAPHTLDSSSAISPAFTPYMRRAIELPSPGHFHDLPLIPTATYDNIFHHHHHHHPTAAAYTFYDYHHHMYAGIPAYLTMPPAPTMTVQSQGIVPPTIRPQSTTELENVKSEFLLQTNNSPIDLSLPVLRQSHSPARLSKPRPFLPLNMPNDDVSHIKIEKGNTSSSGSASGSGSGIDEQKPWDLSRKRRHTDESDEDEGISVHVSVKTSPTPAKVVKLFKPYLLSSDDEDDDAGKKCLPSDASTVTTMPHQIRPSFYDSTSATVRQFQSSSLEIVAAASATTPTATSSSASYWLNHGSPVSGYDSASSTFSACDDIDDRNCDLPMKNSTDVVANAATVAAATVVTATTKYMVPRRHILEKWSHEEDDAYAHQYGLNYHM